MIGVNLASSKRDTGRGKGPLPLEGTDLVEEMSALLARRKRIAEKGSTIEQKEDKKFNKMMSQGSEMIRTLTSDLGQNDEDSGK